MYLIILNSDLIWTGLTCFYFIHSVCLLQWDFYRVARSFSSAEDIERRRSASVSPTKTSPTWATTLQPPEPAAAKRPAVFLGDSSSASLSERQANQKAKAPLLTEVQARWETDYHSLEPGSMALMASVITVKRTAPCKSQDLKQAKYPRRVVTCTYWKEDTSGRAFSFGKILFYIQNRCHV